jgi:uncharacterized repeat protein (TIGR03803 family)
MRDDKGNLYGTTFGGGSNGSGVVFRVDRTGKESVLYSFTAGQTGEVLPLTWLKTRSTTCTHFWRRRRLKLLSGGTDSGAEWSRKKASKSATIGRLFTVA